MDKQQLIDALEKALKPMDCSDWGEVDLNGEVTGYVAHQRQEEFADGCPVCLIRAALSTLRDAQVPDFRNMPIEQVDEFLRSEGIDPEEEREHGRKVIERIKAQVASPMVEAGDTMAKTLEGLLKEMGNGVGHLVSRKIQVAVAKWRSAKAADAQVPQGVVTQLPYAFRPSGTDFEMSLYPDHDHDGGFYLSWLEGGERWSTKLGWCDVMECLAKEYAPPEHFSRLCADIASARTTPQAAKAAQPSPAVSLKKGELSEVVAKYLGEYDNPVPDHMLRRQYRDQMRALIQPETK